MRTSTRVALLSMSMSVPLLLAGVALGGEGLQIKVTNDGTKDVVVTIYDNNVRPRKVIIENAHIGGFSSVPVNVIADETGMGNITWTATSSDGTERRCGRADAHVSDDGTVSVKAEDSCSSLSAG